MQFTQKLREGVKRGDITTSIRIWKSPHVKAGGRYRMAEGSIVVTSIREITWDDVSESMARDSGFRGLVDLLKTARHGSGHKVYFIRFKYQPADAR